MLCNVRRTVICGGLKDAAYELDRVIRILENSPLMTIEAGSHTDSNNTESYNQVLSEKRAKSVKEYFIYNGITQERIISKGYGEMELTIITIQ